MFKIKAIDTDGKSATEIDVGIPQIFESIYGRIEMSVRNIALLVTAMLITGISFGYVVACAQFGTVEPARMTLMLTIPFYLVGWYAALTLSNRHAMDALRAGMGRKAWMVPAAYQTASLATGYGAAALVMEVGGIGGFLLGLAFAISNPLGRVVAETGFMIRISWFKLVERSRSRKGS